MRSWRSADIYRPLARNVVFYEGPSMLNGEPILAIATAQNGNRKIRRAHAAALDHPSHFAV
jgi:hypothetical protein